MDTLKAIQTILELVQKRPLVSFMCLACLLLIIFSPMILKYAPSAPLGQGEHETQAYQNPVTSAPVWSTPQENSIPTSQPEIAESADPWTQPQRPPVTTNPPFGQTVAQVFAADKYFIVAASKPTEQAAVESARTYGGNAAEVYQTPNGWYAITVGQYSRDEAKRILSEKIADGSIPGDAWVSNGLTPGREWLGRVYP